MMVTKGKSNKRMNDDSPVACGSVLVNLMVNPPDDDSSMSSGIGSVLGNLMVCPPDVESPLACGSVLITMHKKGIRKGPLGYLLQEPAEEARLIKDDPSLQESRHRRRRDLSCCGPSERG
ncbi:hypothetical protein KOW79_002183 [Hemibagrus wyckioides]|uniref:Uncharacterized protein n=1 Tax=Hemibagrus wyckioides TaxID=337641 RepID=A0A9D3P384_9TELE|nr:hypothetical protein KOW79_002183 [Hemibagrus wyckioides]